MKTEQQHDHDHGSAHDGGHHQEHPTAHGGHDHHHELPTSGRALSAVALSATLHCLTGCAIGEVLGMVIGTALGWSEGATIALAVGLAFLFGYGLTSIPLIRAGFSLSAVVPIALASDTASITLMETVDNLIMVLIPGAMESGVGDILFWGALSFALVVAGLLAFPLNRWLIARGKGHTAVHNTGVHGGPSPRVVGVVVVVMAIFGTTVLLAELFGGDDERTGGGGHGGAAEPAHEAEPAEGVRGLSASAGGLSLRLERTSVPSGRPAELAFRVVGAGGRPVRDYEVEHEKRMHLIVARRDLTGFLHLHPELDRSGTWRTRATLPVGGAWRVFADFKRGGENRTLAADLTVEGSQTRRPLPAPRARVATPTGYEVAIAGGRTRPGREAEIEFVVTRDGRPVDVEPYLGADGHLVALRDGDLAYLHVHPLEGEEAGHGDAAAPGTIRFATRFPSAATYRLFLQFKHDGRVHTAAFTHAVR